MIKILFFVSIIFVALTISGCGESQYDFAKKECAARGSKLKSYVGGAPGMNPMFVCEDGFRYD